MLDPQILRKDIIRVANMLAKRHFHLAINTLEALEKERKVVQVKTEELQKQRNTHSNEISKAKLQGQDIQSLLDKISLLTNELKNSKNNLARIQEQLNQIILGIPNIPHHSVPEGKTTDDNTEIKKWGSIPNFDFEPRNHVDLSALSGLIDFETASKIASSRFVIMHGAVARLHRILVQFMLDIHINKHGYKEVSVPFIVNTASMFGTGQLPKFKQDLFKVVYGDSDTSDTEFSVNGIKNEMFLIPTAEVPVTNIVRDQILTADEFPRKYVCHTPCFRSEAGAYGQDNRGMIRQHQFEKVELIQMVKPHISYEVLEELTQHAEKILQLLELPYRVVSLCGGDLGFSSAKTYDIEVWLPGQNTYREISSCSNFEDFQSRRMKARWRDTKTGKPAFFHTLNGSGLAIGRTLVAIFENYQDKQGNIHIPEVLKPYMGGIEVIGSDTS